jgi:hypothetical protein
VTARERPATLANGLVVQVPEYLLNGDAVSVDARTGSYISKA